MQAQRQIGTRFRSEQVNHWVFRVRQRVTRAAANMGIMSGQLPAAFLAYQPQAIDGGIEKTALPLRAFTKNQCVQLQPAGKIKPLETITIATPAIFPVVARQNGGRDSPEPAPPPR